MLSLQEHGEPLIYGALFTDILDPEVKNAREVQWAHTSLTRG
jgi:hypothetical protein